MNRQDHNIEARIERLESVLGAIVDLEQLDKKHVVIRGNRFLVLNHSGQMRACLGVNKHQDIGNGSLYLMDRDGNLQAALLAVSDVGGQLSLFSPDQLRKVAAGVDSTGNGRVITLDKEVSSILPENDRQ